MRLLLFITLLITYTGLSQTGTIKGNVTFTDGEPAIGTTVLVTGTQLYSVTDADGHFEIKTVPYGNHTLEIASIEVKTATAKVKLNAPTATVNFKAERINAQELNEVLVSHTSEKRELLDKGFALNIIDTKDAGMRNLQTNDLLDRSVGVRIRQNGGLGSSVNYNLNGMSGNSVRIFIDGIPISTYGSSFNLNSIPPALIERIEVYKGVLPATLADDALGGAINVILKKGARNTINASASYGSFNTFQAQLNGMYRNDKGFTVKASGFYNYSDNDYEVWGKFVYNILPNGRYEYIRAKRFNDAYKSYGGRVEAGYTDVKWADMFLIGYNGSYDYKEIQHGQYMTIPYKGRFTEGDAHALSINYTKKDLFTKGLDVTFNGVYSQRNEVVNDTVKWNYNWQGQIAVGLDGEPLMRPNGGAQQGAPTINHIDREILSSRSSVSYSITDNHKFVFSNLFTKSDRNDRDDMKSELERRFLEVRNMQKTVSSFAYEVKAFKSRLNASLFGKYYQQKVTEHSPTLVTENGEAVVIINTSNRKSDTEGYGIAASYYVTPKIMLLASAEKAVRMPNENELFGNPGENQSANSALKPEISNNLNIGFRAGAYEYKSHKLTFAASGFWRNTQDKIVREINGRVNDAIQTTPSVNLGKTQSLGFEASVDYVYNNRLFLSANMSRFNTLYKTKYDANGNVLVNYNKQLPNEPFFTINGNAQYNFKNVIQKSSELNLYYSCGYVDPFYTNWLEIDRYRTTAQFVQDAGITYIFPKKDFAVSIDARNMFNKQLYDNFAVQKPGRAFYIKLNYTINNFKSR